MGARWSSASFSCGPRGGCMARRSRASGFVAPLRHRAAGCTGCAVTTRLQDFSNESDKWRMSAISSAVGGLERAQTSLEQVAGRLAKASSTKPEDTVDLSAEMVKLMHARNAFQS